MQCAVDRVRPQRARPGGRQHAPRFDTDTPHPVICLLDDQHVDHRQGRHDAAGLLPVRARPRAAGRSRPTAATLIHERHRHRYEFNNQYRQQFAAHGMVVDRHQPRRQAGRDDRAAATIRGSWRCSSTRSSSRSRPRPTRCSPASSGRHWSGTAYGASARARLSSRRPKLRNRFRSVSQPTPAGAGGSTTIDNQKSSIMRTTLMNWSRSTGLVM